MHLLTEKGFGFVLTGQDDNYVWIEKRIVCAVRWWRLTNRTGVRKGR
jgi:hypothetical protein